MDRRLELLRFRSTPQAEIDLLSHYLYTHYHHKKRELSHFSLSPKVIEIQVDNNTNNKIPTPTMDAPPHNCPRCHGYFPLDEYFNRHACVVNGQVAPITAGASLSSAPATMSTAPLATAPAGYPPQPMGSPTNVGTRMQPYAQYSQQAQFQQPLPPQPYSNAMPPPPTGFGRCVLLQAKRLQAALD